MQSTYQSPSSEAGPQLHKGGHDQPLPPVQTAVHGGRTQVMGTFLFLLGVVVLLQWNSGAYHSEVGGHPDEPGHYVTGLLFHDYFLAHPAGSPVEFARRFYSHYPKVCIGHWPPVFYIAQGIWSLVFSPSIRSTLFLVALIYAFLGAVVVATVRRVQGPWIGVLAGVLYLVIPIVRQGSSFIMADGLVSLFMAVATLTFLRFTGGTHTARYSLAFGVLASLAILTKGSALGLALVPVVMVLLLRRWEVLRWGSLWISPAAVIALCGPWYWMTRGLQTGGWTSSVPRSIYAGLAVRTYANWTWKEIGPLGTILAALGVLIVLASLRDRRHADEVGAAMISLYVGTIAVTVLIPTGVEPRFVLPALIPLIYFVTQGALGIAKWTAASLTLPNSYETACSVALLLIVAGLCWSPYRKEFTGYSKVADAIVRSPSPEYPAVLVVSDVPGEGMFVADMADLRTTADTIVIRGTKVLADMNWSGDQYRSRWSSPSEVLEYLDKIPVTYVIDDRSVDGKLVLRHQKLFELAIAEHPDSFRLLDTSSVTRSGSLHPESVYLYQFVHSKPPERTLQIPMVRTTGSSFEVFVPEVKTVGSPFRLVQ